MKPTYYLSQRTSEDNFLRVIGELLMELLSQSFGKMFTLWSRLISPMIGADLGHVITATLVSAQFIGLAAAVWRAART